MKRKAVYVGVALVVLIVVILSRDDTVDHEAQIRAAILDTIEAAEKKDLKGILTHVSEDFRSAGMDKKKLKGLLFVQLQRGAWRKIFLTDSHITIEPGDDPQKAQVALVAVLATGKEVNSLADVMPTNAGRYRFELAFARQERWRVNAATYERVPY